MKRSELAEKMHKLSATKEELSSLNLDRYRQKVQNDKDAVIQVINRKDGQLQDYKQKMKKFYEEDLKEQA